MKRLLVFIFSIVFLVSCSLNGEKKICNNELKKDPFQLKEITKIIEEHPNDDVCKVTFFENSRALWYKTYVNDVLVFEYNISPHHHTIFFDEKGDTTYYKYKPSLEFTYYKSDIFLKGNYVGYEIRVEYNKRTDISELRYMYDKDDKFILLDSYCKDKNNKFCDCPSSNLDKYLKQFYAEKALAVK